ncbi:MAG: CocE/NonD family hydrolase [Candidatus Lokiarchaeota archaeon]|nr:CocE/NonD family hydrolase [Candidatus Lokiarchaeota archaeon]
MKRARRALEVLAIVGVAASMVANGLLFWYSDNSGPFVRMRDGFKLYTRVHLPENWTVENGSLPVILLRTPYDVDGEGNVAAARAWAAKGYAAVWQDIRGTHGSAGTGSFPVFLSEQDDAYDTATWIMAQPWCDGRIATVGASAEAFTQVACHAAGSPGVVAAYIHAGASELYDHWMYPGGCLRKNFVESWLPGVSGMRYYPTLVQNARKGEFWLQRSLTMGNQFEAVGVRAVHFGGWYDCFQAGTIESFAYYSQNATAYARDHQILVMGPWIHGSMNHSGVPEYATVFNTSASMGYAYADAAREFIFGEALLGESRNWSAQPRVYYVLMGDPADTAANTWKNATGWPVASTSEPWYFHPNGSLSISAPTQGNRSYAYDPRDPVHTGGGRAFPVQAGTIDVPITYGAFDNRQTEAGRPDVLQFTSGNLTSAVEIAGYLHATLNVASNCTDTDFAVKLLDIFPDGREIYVADGILKARYRGGFSSADEAPLVPGQAYELDIDMWSMAYRFWIGHRIRVSVTSSNYPEYAVNPNTGGPVGPWGPADMGAVPHSVANNTVLLGQGGSPSCVWLPRTA